MHPTCGHAVVYTRQLGTRHEIPEQVVTATSDAGAVGRVHSMCGNAVVYTWRLGARYEIPAAVFMRQLDEVYQREMSGKAWAVDRVRSTGGHAVVLAGQLGRHLRWAKRDYSRRTKLDTGRSTHLE